LTGYFFNFLDHIKRNRETPVPIPSILIESRPSKLSKDEFDIKGKL
jgi:hypothetical protein